ncbi:MAG: fused response regulator/phosphatase [Gammaproteobacteria bacterium]|nr:fused response regulator/phosphatase [Gammaproteobacteria bacterium]
MLKNVLVVDDDQTNRLILRNLLEREGLAVTMAENGAQALEACACQRFALILMDVMMPVMDGYEATRRIKHSASVHFTPVIFLTAMQDDEQLARCVDAGGDDFLTKPYNHVILKSKIRAMLRISDLHDTVLHQNQQLNQHQQLLIEEQQIAERIFKNVVNAGGTDIPGIRVLLSPTSVFNGDLVLSARRSTGELHVLVGDFTGHGLSAAVGTVPVSDIFYAMTSEGFSIGDIAAAINRKIKQIMPANIFFAATLLSVDALEKKFVAWNGGMPEVLIIDVNNRIRQRVRSQHLPLGVMEEAMFDRAVDVFAVEYGERIYACSDGLIDAPIATGGRFTKEGYLECFGPHVGADQLFDWIVGSLHEIHGDGPQDDLTLVEIVVNEALASIDNVIAPVQHQRNSTAWQVNFELSAHTLRQVDPVPLLMRVLSEIQGLERHKEILYTILAELITNAVDHGILRLDSALKSTPAGFANYYTERSTRLAQLDGGSLRIELLHAPQPRGGRLTLRISDSGPGFDYKTAPRGSGANAVTSGRGMHLLRTLCESIEYSGNGNCVEAVFVWNV